MVGEGRVIMSGKELRRVHVIRQAMETRITQVKAGALLTLTPRHVRRLMERVRSEGDRGLVHRGRGQPSNRRLRWKQPWSGMLWATAWGLSFPRYGRRRKIASARWLRPGCWLAHTESVMTCGAGREQRLKSASSSTFSQQRASRLRVWGSFLTAPAPALPISWLPPFSDLLAPIVRLPAALAGNCSISGWLF